MRPRGALRWLLGARRQAAPDATSAALAPVATALLARAHARALQELASAEDDARAALSRARAEAERLLAVARAEGVAAAEHSAATQLALARREVHEMVLAAHRRLYDELRSRVNNELLERAPSPEGRRLAARMSALVRERVDSGAPVRVREVEALEAIAESGNRLAVLEPSALIDAALAAGAEEIASLWA